MLKTLSIKNYTLITALTLTDDFQPNSLCKARLSQCYSTSPFEKRIKITFIKTR